MNMEAFNKAYQQRPFDDVCSKEVEITIVGERCVYINNYRVEGGKPYYSENLPQKTKTTAMRKIFDAFSVEEIKAYISEKERIEAYMSGVNAYRDAVDEVLKGDL